MISKYFLNRFPLDKMGSRVQLDEKETAIDSTLHWHE